MPLKEPLLTQIGYFNLCEEVVGVLLKFVTRSQKKKPCFDKYKANTSNTMIFNIILFANPTVFADFVGFANAFV